MEPVKNTYVKGIDSLRCLAVMMVFIFHNRMLPFGWVGVWIFFVISGFSITTSLLRSSDHPHEKRDLIKNFYARRCLRIWPLYFFYIAVVYVALAAFNQHPALKQIPYLLSFTYNFFNIFQPLDNPASHYLGHLWTLSVEEQFYIIYPIAFTFLSRRRLIWFLVALVIACPALRFLLGQYVASLHRAKFAPADVIYLFGPAAFDAFAFGCLTALYRPALTVRKATGLWAMIALFGTAFVYGASYSLADPLPKDFSTYHGPFDILSLAKFGQYREIFCYILVTVIAAAMIILTFVNPTGPLHRIFLRACEFRAVQYLGKISFGIYVFHPAVLLVLWSHWGIMDSEQLGATNRMLRLVVLILALGVTTVLAALSHKYFEKPFLGLRKKFD